MGQPPVGFGVGPPVQSTSGPIGDLGPWFGESFRLSIDRAGHFLPMILLFVISVGLFNAFAIWYGFQDSSLTVDSQSGDVSWVYGGSNGWLILAALSIPVSVILTAVMKASVIRQAWSVQAGKAEPWSDSVSGAMARSSRVIPVALGRALIYWLTLFAFILAVGALPGLILLTPLVFLFLFAVWVGFSFIGQTAALAGTDHGAYRTSLGLARLQVGALIGRLLLLALVAVSAILAFILVGNIFTLIAGGPSESTVEFGAETIRSEDVLGPSVMLAALGSVFTALGLGANQVLTTVGTTLLYRNLDGPVGDDAPGVTEADTGLGSGPVSGSGS